MMCVLYAVEYDARNADAVRAIGWIVSCTYCIIIVVPVMAVRAWRRLFCRAGRGLGTCWYVSLCELTKTAADINREEGLPSYIDIIISE